MVKQFLAEALDRVRLSQLLAGEERTEAILLENLGAGDLLLFGEVAGFLHQDLHDRPLQFLEVTQVSRIAEPLLVLLPNFAGREIAGGVDEVHDAAEERRDTG